MVAINNSINNSVGGSNSGVTNTFTISNDSNTASSAANQQITVGGATASDPQTTYTITGATSFSVGIDNSASDAFVIAASTALGTTNVMSVATTGQINYPLQPAFVAYLSGNLTNKTGDGTNYTIIFDSTLKNIGTCYNTSTGTFTAPVAGTYIFNMNVFLTNLGVAHNSGSGGLISSNTAHNLTYYQGNPGIVAAGASFVVNSSVIIPMAASETLIVQMLVSGSTKTVGLAGGAALNTTFSGAMLL